MKCEPVNRNLNTLTLTCVHCGGIWWFDVKQYPECPKTPQREIADCRAQLAATEKTRDHYFVESERNIGLACTLHRELAASQQREKKLLELLEQTLVWVQLASQERLDFALTREAKTAAALHIRIIAALASEPVSGEGNNYGISRPESERKD